MCACVVDIWISGYPDLCVCAEEVEEGGPGAERTRALEYIPEDCVVLYTTNTYIQEYYTRMCRYIHTQPIRLSLVFAVDVQAEVGVVLISCAGADAGGDDVAHTRRALPPTRLVLSAPALS